MEKKDIEFDNLSAPFHIVNLGASFLRLAVDLKVELVARDKLPDPKIKSIFSEDDWTIYFNQEWLDSTQLVEAMYESFYQARRAYQCFQVLYKEKGLVPYYKENEKRVDLWKDELESLNDKVDPSLDIELDAHAFAYYMMKKLFTVKYPIQYEDEKKFMLRVDEIDNVLQLKQNSI